MFIKTTTLIVGGTVLGGALLLGLGPLSSYLRTSARVAQDNLHDAVPAGFEIERIQTLVGDLDQVITEQQSKLVTQRVDLEYLQDEVTRAEQRLAHLQNEVAAARDLLAEEQDEYRIGDRHYDRATVIREAKDKAAALERVRTVARAKAETVEALQNALAQAENQLTKARSQRDTYAMRLSELRAKAENVAIRQQLVTSIGNLPDAIDHGAFQEVEQAFKRVEKKIEVQDRMLAEADLALPDADDIAFSAPPAEDVLAFLDRALERDTAAAADAATVAESKQQDQTTDQEIEFTR
jgi:DNA repair exonuclease SbcCD ATPase subunit